MQEEITKHTKKAFKTMTNKKFTFGEKIKEVALEIFIIVFAVTLSISLHSWSEGKHQQEEAKEFLIDLKKDMVLDSENLKESRFNIDEGIKEYKFLNNLTKEKLDSLHNKVSMAYREQNFYSSIGNYEGFKSSGKLGYIENKELKTKILNFYQQTLPGINSVQKLFQDKHDYIINNVVINTDIDAEKRFLNPATKFRLQMLIAVSKNLSEQYKEASKQINEITNEINTEYKD